MVGQGVRVRLRATKARVYSIYATEPGEEADYRSFTAAYP